MDAVKVIARTACVDKGAQFLHRIPRLPAVCCMQHVIERQAKRRGRFAGGAKFFAYGFNGLLIGTINEVLFRVQSSLSLLRIGAGIWECCYGHENKKPSSGVLGVMV
jgi:hypothetical protein